MPDGERAFAFAPGLDTLDAFRSPPLQATMPSTLTDVVASLFVAVAAAAPGQAPNSDSPLSPGLAATLAAAGDNRVELEKALDAVTAAERTSLEFLLTHMPKHDAQTLSAEFLVGQVKAAHLARAQAPWGSDLSDELFRAFVLPYVQATEKRMDWRSDFARRFTSMVADCKTPGEAALRLNGAIFAALGVRYSTSRARADQDPQSSIAQGKASCTGLSILLADACRAVAVPARLVSVMWPHKAGNHTWVEVWDGRAWRFVGAAEPDPNGLDRAWFVGDAARCRSDDPTHAIWAVSFAATAQRFRAGWAPDVELNGIDVTQRYAPAPAAADNGPATQAGSDDSAADEALLVQLGRFFAATADEQAKFEFDRNLDAELASAAGDARLRRLAWRAYRAAPHLELRADYAANRVRAGGYESPYTVHDVGVRGADGYALVIAMHGGGGVPKQVNDQQWQVMQRYYREHPEAGGYRYVALRAPTDAWNGFYTDYVYPLIEALVVQFTVCGDVAPDRVSIIGYSHGGYGVFAIAPKMPDRFAAAHASAAAPTDGETSVAGLHHLPFSFMVGAADTAYGRAERCRAFAASAAEARAAHPDLYPITGAILDGQRHTGLPDRDKLAELVPQRRLATPTELIWELTDGVVRDHYWLGVEAPARGSRVAAKLSEGCLEVRTTGVGRLRVRLDARLCDLGAALTVQRDGHASTLHLAPSLRTLCASLQERRDPDLAGSCELWLAP